MAARMAIRRFIARFGLAGLLIALVAACAPDSAGVPQDVLVVGQVAEPQSLDPATVTAVNDFRILVNLYEGLVRYAPDSLEVEPAIAESWTISEDGRIYTFTLRKGLTFHDGTPVDAAAVKFNFDRMLDENHPMHEETGPFPLAFFFDAIEKTEALDDHTVRFTLTQPYAPFLSNLAYPPGMIVSPAAVRKYGARFGRNPVGSGPFAFTAWESNVKVVLHEFDGYREPTNSARVLVFRPITDGNARVAAMLSGELDLMVEVPPDSLALFENKPAEFTVHEQVGPHVWFLILNMRREPFSDPRMRQAVNLAVNKQAIVDNVLQGTATVAAGPTPEAFGWAHNDALEPWPYDPEKAKALIGAAGYDGEPLMFYVAEGGSGMLQPVAMATAIQADLAKVGIPTVIETYEWNTYLSRVNAGLDEADMAEMAWMTNNPDTLPYLTLRTGAFPDQGGFNSGYYSNPKVDELIERARTATDRGLRAALYKQMQQIVHDDAPWLFVANWKQHAVTAADVRGFDLHPSFLLFLENVHKP
ncbi:MAG TPA: ABC transporter substrate-binding protein [Woeseiaceae bacterium]|nr:ABC transporter substrate-binding protein [Woeseiaceae bacterium]